MTVTAEQLVAIMPAAGERIPAFLAPLNAAMTESGITSAKRAAAFLAQVAHESGQLRWLKEIGDAAYFAKYEGRKDLGNEQPGDGARYCGRGLLQVTGRAEYAACGEVFGLDLVGHPELLEQPEGACRSAGWVWTRRGLNPYADGDRFFAITRAINGAFSGGDSRLAYWLCARRVLGVA